MPDQPHFAIMSPKSAENVIVMIVLNQFLSLAPRWLTIGCLLKQVNKPARNLQVPAKVRSYQALVKNVDFHGGSWLALTFAASISGKISTR